MSEAYSAFIASRPLASPPFLQGDTLGLIRGGTTYQLPASLIPAYSGNVAITSSLSTGAVGNGIIDDTAVLNSLFTTLSNAGGGIVIVPAGTFHYIAGVLTVPSNVWVWGGASPFTGWGNVGSINPLTTGCGFFLHPTAAYINARGATALRSLKIFRWPSAATQPLLANPNASQIQAAVTQWGVETQAGLAAIVLTDAATGFVELDDLFIVGFNTGIYSAIGDFYISRALIDCYNGLLVVAAGDINVHRDMRCEPWYGIGVGAGLNGVNWRRPGIAYHVNARGLGDDVWFRDCYAFCWDTGFKFESVSVDLDNCIFDNTSINQAVYPQTGMLFADTITEANIKNQRGGGATVGIDIQGGNTYLIVNPDISVPNPSTVNDICAIRVRHLGGNNTFGNIVGGHLAGPGAGTVPMVIIGANLGGKWKITSPYIDSGYSPWITIDATMVGNVQVSNPDFSNGGNPAQDARNQGALVSGASLACVVSNAGSPSGTSSAVQVMMGLGVTITPNASGRIEATISFDAGNTVGGDGVVAQIRYGTGAQPANNAPATGTAVGLATTSFPLGPGQPAAVTLTFVVGSTTGSRLTCGTTYWFDVGLAAVTGGTASIANCVVQLIELPAA